MDPTYGPWPFFQLLPTSQPFVTLGQADPRLLRCANIGGRWQVEEVHGFVQAALDSRSANVTTISGMWCAAAERGERNKWARDEPISARKERPAHPGRPRIQSVDRSSRCARPAALSR